MSAQPNDGTINDCTISVIIPAVNEEPTIGLAVASAWRASADEVIVVDGGSQDRTVEISREHRATVVCSSPGRAIQQNAGAAYATGEALVFLHADNTLGDSAVRQLRDALKDPAVVLGGFQQQIAAPGWPFRLLERGNRFRARYLGYPYGDQAIFIRRTTFEAAGRFPEIPLMEDVALLHRCRRFGWPLILPGPVIVSPRRWQRHGIVRQTLRNWSLVVAYALGGSPEQLALRYRRHDEQPPR